MASAGTVTLVLDANSIKLLRELKKAQNETRKTARTMNNSLAGAMKKVAQAARVAGVAFAAMALRKFASDIVNAGLAMERFSRTFKVSTGSAELAAQEMEFVSHLSNQLGTDLLTTADAYAKLTAAAKGTALAGAGTRKVFTSLAQATTVLGLSAADASQILTAVEQMISKGKVSAEELRRQMQKLPGAFSIAARAMGVTTQELDKMLSSGKLMAEDLLPKLADELDKTFGPGVEEAANSTQAALNRFNNAILDIKAGIAESGVMDALAAFAQGIANVINPELGLDIQKTQTHIDQMIKRRDELLAIPRTERSSAQGTELWNLGPQLEAAQKRLDKLLESQGNLMAPKFGDGGAGDGAGGGDTTALDAFRKKFETAEQTVARLRKELEGFKKDINPKEFERINAEIGKLLTDSLDKIKVTSKKKFGAAKKSMEEMTEFSKQAARNMQDAFADFLFDPFEDGLKGMLKGFLDTIRRMMAEAAAAKIFGDAGKSDGALTAFFSGLFGGGKASGGPVSGGTSYIVGEKGPELFTPGASGMITPNHKLSNSGGVVVNQNYEIAAGADWQTLQKVLPPLFEQNRQSTIAEFVQMRAEGAV